MILRSLVRACASTIGGLALTALLPLSVGAQTTLTGTLAADGTLDVLGNPYIVNADFEIPAGLTLTINEGVDIVIEGLFSDFIVNGTLNALGSSSQPITIRSFTGTGAGTVRFNSGSSGELNHVQFDSLSTGGSAAIDAALYLEEAIPMANCSFTRSAQADLRARATAVTNLFPSNSFGTGQIELLQNTLDTTATWPQASASPVTYVLLGDQTVSEGDSLTIESGVSVELNSVFTDLIVDGHLEAVGASGQRVRFFRNDASGGGSVALRKGSSANIDFSRFENLGVSGSSAFDCALYVDSADLLLARTIFENNTVDIEARADALSNASNNNQLDLVFLRQNTIAKSSTLRNLSASGTFYRSGGDQTVPAGMVYTIEPDVTLQLNSVFTDFLVDGTLLADAGGGSFIQFIAGSSGGGSLALRDGSTASLTGVLFDSLGTNGSSAFDAALRIDDADLILDNCLFTDNTVDIRGQADRLKAFDGSTGIKNNNSLERVVLLPNSLNESVTWPSFTGSGATVVMNGDQTVPAGETLTITAPLDIHFESLFEDLSVFGNLIAEGNESDSIRFIGINAAGGGSVAFRSDSLTGSLRYAVFDNMGNSGSSAFDCALYTDGSAVAVAHSQFRNCTVDVKGHGESFSAFEPNNGMDTVEVETPDIDRNAHWVLADTNGIVYRLRGDLDALAGTVLTIDAGVRVEFTSLFHDLTIHGGLQAIGTVYDSILFVGTATNGGGSVLLADGSFNHDLAYCGFEAMGLSGSSAFDCGLQVSTAGNTDIFACKFEALDLGIKATGTANPNIEGCAFRNNINGVDVRNGASAIISYSAFTGHTGLAVDNDAANAPLNVCDNWWGGGQAFNATNYPSGTGDPIGDNVQSNPGCLMPVDPHVVCIPPQASLDEVTGPAEVRFAWQRVPGAFGYRLEATKDDTLKGIFLTAINRRTQSSGIVPGDTITWQVKTGCPFDTSILSAVDTVVVPLLAREGATLGLQLQVWPQPAHGLVQFARPSAEGQVLGDALLRLYDSKGIEAVPAIRFREGERIRQLDVQALPAGVYFYRLSGNNTKGASGTVQVL